MNIPLAIFLVVIFLCLASMAVAHGIMRRLELPAEYKDSRFWRGRKTVAGLKNYFPVVEDSFTRKKIKQAILLNNVAEYLFILLIIAAFFYLLF